MHPPVRLLVGSIALTAAVASLTASPVATAAAAPETCLGRTATIVGTPLMMLLEGTDGDDVIVTNGARNVHALGGDDLVCIAGTGVSGTGANGYAADGGAGSDTIVNQDDGRVATNVLVDMGEGDGTTETYVGGAGPDDVTLSGRRTVARIRTGGDADLVHLSHPPRRVAIDLGGGDDTLDLPFGTATRGRIAGGGGTYDTLNWFGARTRGPRVHLDNRHGEVRVGRTRALRLAGLEAFTLYGFDASPLTVTGGPAAESVFVPYANTLLRQVDLGGGSDEVRLGLGARAPQVLRGGGGVDRLALSAFPGDRAAARVTADLAARRVRVHARSGGRPRDIAVGSFETVFLSAGRVRLLGTDRADTVNVAACVGFVDGRGGDDVIDDTTRSGDSDGDTVADPEGCSSVPTFEARGGPGNDLLLGSEFPDVLVGGEGLDVAEGEGGGDECDAETTSGCDAEALPPILR